MCKTMTPNSKICIVMAVHNGAEFLPEQLESIKSQVLPPRWIIISDDDSTDDSSRVIREFFKSWRECEPIFVKGPCKDYAQNFMTALKFVPQEADYVALADQDDIWFDDKLLRALGAIQSDQEHPALYGSASWVWEPRTNARKLSRRTKVPLGFGHAIAQNFAGGNTMVFNRKAIHLVQTALPKTNEIPVHDWWIYQLISGAGGTVHYDEKPALLYRQHSLNQIGANEGLAAMAARCKAMLRGKYRNWNTANLTALKLCDSLLTPENRKLLDELQSARSSRLDNRFRIFSRGMVWRHGIIGQAGLALSLVLNRF